MREIEIFQRLLRREMADADDTKEKRERLWRNVISKKARYIKCKGESYELHRSNSAGQTGQ